LVRFDNGQEKELPSDVLKVESALASIPPDVPVPVVANVVGHQMQEETYGDADLLDVGEEAEDLPAMRPEEEDVMAAEEEQIALELDDAPPDEVTPETPENATAEAPVHDPNGRMPGQLPTKAAASHKDYQTLSELQKRKLQCLLAQK
jgi:hypothetical protein